jgi:hypothetical protein
MNLYAVPGSPTDVDWSRSSDPGIGTAGQFWQIGTPEQFGLDDSGGVDTSPFQMRITETASAAEPGTNALAACGLVPALGVALLRRRRFSA